METDLHSFYLNTERVLGITLIKYFAIFFSVLKTYVSYNKL